MLSVVMPAHNEEAFLGSAVREVVDAVRSRGWAFDVVVVENGSSDATLAIARTLADELPEVQALSMPDADYGGALKRGFLEATGDLVAIFDVDYYDFAFLDRAVAAIESPDGPDIVVGSKRGAGAVDARAWVRRTITTVFSLILRYGFGLRVADTHGIKVVRRAPLKDLAAACRYGTDLFDTELILRAERAGFKAGEVPVVVQELRPSRSSILRRIPRTVANLVRLRVYLWQDRA